jgi:hypothetical protein
MPIPGSTPDPLPSMTPAEAATTLRHAVAALSRRSALELGELVPALSPERTAALTTKLERLGGPAGAPSAAAGHGAFDHDDVVTLDSWIRLADSATLHDDVVESDARTTLAAQLRAVRLLVAPAEPRLSEDPREG